MPLTASALSSLVFTDHLAAFPEGLAATRENAATGVLTHNVPEELIKALCSAFVQAVTMSNVKIMAIVTGTADVVGSPVAPTTFSFPGTAAAVSGFLADQEWTGESAQDFADIVIGSVLTRCAELALLHMDSGKVVGTGVGVVSSTSNPGLKSIVEGNLGGLLASEFTASNYFGQDDIPGATVNSVLAAQLPAYAKWLATGFATMTASPAYVGNTQVTSSASETGTGTIS